MAQHYEVKEGETLAIQGPANIIVKAGVIPLVGALGPPPVLSSLSPDTAAIGDPDVVMTATGSGFTANSVINFNGGDEPTTFVSDTELSTTVRPSTATTAGSYPVLVKNGPQASAPQDFTFTEPGVTRTSRRR
jgi:IPT/TIG domain